MLQQIQVMYKIKLGKDMRKETKITLSQHYFYETYVMAIISLPAYTGRVFTTQYIFVGYTVANNHVQ